MIWRHFGLPARAVLLVIVSLTIAGVAGWLLRDTWDLPAVMVASAGIALAGGALLAYRWFAPPMQALRAVADGLLSYVERDYGVRLADPIADDPAGLVRRFNQLGDLLRSSHDDSYQKEMLLETVLGATPTAIVLENEAGRIVYANGTARDLFADGRALEGHVFERVLDELAPELRAATRGEEDVLFSVEHEGEPQVYDVARRYFHINTQPHKLWMVRPLGRDLERREAEAWKKAIRVMSHEINNSLAPIVSLVGSARTLNQAAPGGGNPRLGLVFDTIAERAQHLHTFLDGFGRVSRLPSPTIKEVEWQGFFTAIHGLYEFQLEGDLPCRPACFDAAQMQQVLINLLKNAVEASGERPAVSIRVVEQPNAITVEVADRGSGMSDEVRRRALLPFYSTKKSGAGLGLSLCREIVEAHGGRLALHGRSGGGTVVEVWLPQECRS